MVTPSYSRSLYDCATECALKRAKRKCRVQYGSALCKTCPFDVAQYVDADPRQLKLFMMQANTRAYAMRASNRLPIAVGIGILVLIGLVWYSNYRFHQRIRETAYPTVQVAAPTATAPAAGSKPIIRFGGGNEEYVVDHTLLLVEQFMAAETDMTGDGKSNCQDASVLFYSFFPDRDKVRIMVNYNPDTGMNHMFVYVLWNGQWYAIEPDSRYYATPIGSRQWTCLMTKLYGSRYVPALDKDYTTSMSAWAYTQEYAAKFWE